MKSKKPLLIFIVSVACIAILFFLFWYPHVKQSYKPIPNKGNKWRIGYIQSGDYQDYNFIMDATLHGLQDKGWIKSYKTPNNLELLPGKEYWDYINNTVTSSFIQFVNEAFWSYDWNTDQRLSISETIQSKTSTFKLDVLFVLGSWAGRDISETHLPIPCIVMSASNPLESDIVKSDLYSGVPNVVTMVDTNLYIRRIRLFYHVTHFTSIGVLVYPSNDGPVWANLENLKEVGKELGFSVIPYYTSFDPGENPEKAIKNFPEYYRWLIETNHIDAVWIPVDPVETIPGTMEAISTYRIPSWGGSMALVKAGVLLGINDGDSTKAGNFYADTFAKIAHGVPPEKIYQKVEREETLCINTKTAEEINFDVTPALDKIISVRFQD